MERKSGSFRKKKVYFTQISNSALRDANLSLKAKGLYSLIQSYITIEDFILYKTFLMKQCKEGVDGFNSTWNELKKAGYLIQYKTKDEKGTFYYEYELLDEIEKNDPHTENTHMVTPGVDFPHVVNGGCINNTDYNNTDYNNTNNTTEKTKDVSSSSNKEIIEVYTSLKLSDNMCKKVSSWDREKLHKAIQIFNKEKGQYFKLLEKIYRDDNNYKISESVIDPMRFNNFSAREYDYNKLEAQLLGWDK